jgi:hypothetical protein
MEDFAIEEPAFRNLTKRGEQCASDHQSPFRLHGVKDCNVIGYRSSDG